MSALSVAFLGVEWTRPLGLVALLLPAIVLLLARARPWMPTLATGTLALWEGVAPSPPHAGARARGPIGLPIALLALGLTLGALALAGPRPSQPVIERTWRVIVDRSPSMYRAGSTGEIPIVAAAHAVERWLASALAPGDRVLWIAPNGSRGEQSAGASLPSAWLAPPRIPRSPPRFADEDRAGVLWLTRAPLAIVPRTAGVCAAAVEPTRGPIAVQGTTRFDWDGERIQEVAGGGAPMRVLVPDRLPEPIDALVATWAQVRGHALERDSPPDAERGADVVLAIRRAPDGAERTVDVGRDGWRARGVARGAARAADEDGDLAAWLDADGVALVTFGPGRIESALRAMEPPSGDPAAFAVSWAELLDAAALPHPAVVPLAERLAREPMRFEPPRATPLSESGGPPPEIDGPPPEIDGPPPDAAGELAAWLSLVAAGLALAAWWLARSSRALAPLRPIGYTQVHGPLRSDG